MDVRYDGSKLRREIAQQKIDIYNREMKLKKEQEEPKYKAMKAESEERQEIQGSIIKMAREGKKKIDILIYLNNNYPNSSSGKYFATWIDYHFSKLGIREENGPKEIILRQYQRKNNLEDVYLSMKLINKKIGREVLSKDEIDKWIKEYDKAKNGEKDEKDRED